MSHFCGFALLTSSVAAAIPISTGYGVCFQKLFSFVEDKANGSGRYRDAFHSKLCGQKIWSPICHVSSSFHHEFQQQTILLCQLT